MAKKKNGQHSRDLNSISSIEDSVISINCSLIFSSDLVNELYDQNQLEYRYHVYRQFLRKSKKMYFGF